MPYEPSIFPLTLAWHFSTGVALHTHGCIASNPALLFCPSTSLPVLLIPKPVQMFKAVCQPDASALPHPETTANMFSSEAEWLSARFSVCYSIQLSFYAERIGGKGWAFDDERFFS